MKKIKIYPKKERYIFVADGFYTNGHWALKQEFCEEIWEKELKPFPREVDVLAAFGGFFDPEYVELKPSRFLVEQYNTNNFARRYDHTGEVPKSIYIDETFHQMFKKAAFNFKFFGSSKDKPILITTDKNEFVGVVMGMRVDEERR
jgi:hypothetical protein